MPLKKTKSKLWIEWIAVAFGALVLVLAAGAALGASCDLKNNPPAFVRHDLSASYCELCGYGYINIVISNPYQGADMTNMTVVENLLNSGLIFDPTAPNSVTYRVNNGGPQSGSAPAVSGSNGSTLTWASAQIPDLGRLEYGPDNNQFNTINALAANNVVLQGCSPCLVASNNIVDFIVTGDFAAFTSNCPWGDNYERYANTSVYLGGKIWTCG